MLYLVLKTLISAVVVVAASEAAKRSAGFGALIASLPLVSILAVLWLWRDTGDRALVADLLQGTFWYVLATLPMFLLVPFMLRTGVSFFLSLAAGIALTAALYAILSTLLTKLGVEA